VGKKTNFSFSMSTQFFFSVYGLQNFIPKILLNQLRPP